MSKPILDEARTKDTVLWISPYLLADLGAALPPEHRFTDGEGGLVLFSFVGKLTLYPDRRTLRGVIVRPERHNKRKEDKCGLCDLLWDDCFRNGGHF